MQRSSQSAIDNALQSNKPPTLSAASYLRKAKQNYSRGGFGQSNIGNCSNLTNKLVPPPANKSAPPPLQPSVQRIPPPIEKPTVLGTSPNRENLDSVLALEDSNPATNEMARSGLRTKIPHSVKSGSKVEMKKVDFDKFAAEVEEAGKKREAFELMESNNADLLSQNKKLKVDLQQSESANTDLTKKLQETSKELRKAQQLATTDKKKGRSRKGTPKDINARKDERNTDVMDAIKAFIKEVLFRSTKFAQHGPELTNATVKVWNAIKDNLALETGDDALDEKEFCEIYEGYVLECLSDRRQYVQTRAGTACKEFYNRFGFLPEVEEFSNPWSCEEPPQDASAAEKAQAERKKQILLFYLDDFLPQVAGLDNWGEDRRPVHLMTDLAKVPGDPSGDEKVMVTVTSEAFGLLVYENCRAAWIETIKYKRTHGIKARVPKYDKNKPETHKYSNKFTTSASGQIVNGGWSLEGMKRFNHYMGLIQGFRGNKDMAEKWMEYGRELIKERHQDRLDGKKAATTETKTNSTKDAEETIELIVLDE